MMGGRVGDIADGDVERSADDNDEERKSSKE